MSYISKDLGVILAATEVAPAEWRDLSDLLEEGGVESLWHEISPDCRPSRLLRYIRGRIDPARVAYWHEEVERLSQKHPMLSVLAVTDPVYPENLRKCYDRPPFICIDGTLAEEDQRGLAIVGSRTARDNGLGFAYETAQAAAAAGITVISGLARGIDGAAHRATLETGGRTLAVLGAGIDVEIYPPEHDELAEQIRLSGATISHFRPGSPPTKSGFVARNAVISGLSRVSLLVEAGERSGTRTEAESALKQDRTVLLWSPALENVRWARLFAQQPGVRMVTSVEEVLEAVDEYGR